MLHLSLRAARVAAAQHRSAKQKRRELDTCSCAPCRVDGETIDNIKGRIAQCRRLAAFTTDQHVAKILLQMAEEAEADLRRIGDDSANEPHQITIYPGSPKTGA